MILVFSCCDAFVDKLRRSPCGVEVLAKKFVALLFKLKATLHKLAQRHTASHHHTGEVLRQVTLDALQ
jgi:hypothetical protein